MSMWRPPTMPETRERVREPVMWPVDLDAIASARERIASYVPPSPLRSYGVLDAEVGGGIRVMVKHENFNPTGSFKVRNAFSFMTALSQDERRYGIVAATRQFKVNVPIVIRLTGTNEAEAIKILNGVGMPALSDMDQAVEQVVKLAREAA